MRVAVVLSGCLMLAGSLMACGPERTNPGFEAATNNDATARDGAGDAMQGMDARVDAGPGMDARPDIVVQDVRPDVPQQQDVVRDVRPDAPSSGNEGGSGTCPAECFDHAECDVPACGSSAGSVRCCSMVSMSRIPGSGGGCYLYMGSACPGGGGMMGGDGGGAGGDGGLGGDAGGAGDL